MVHLNIFRVVIELRIREGGNDFHEVEIARPVQAENRDPAFLSLSPNSELDFMLQTNEKVVPVGKQFPRLAFPGFQDRGKDVRTSRRVQA